MCSWVEFCSGPRLGIYISLRLRLGVVPLFVDVEVKSIWSWPFVVRYLLHYILLEYCDGCPIANMSVWVGFLYTVVSNLPSLPGKMRMSKKGIEQSSLDSSQVNLMLLSMEFRCCSREYPSIQDVRLQDDEHMVSYDVEAWFTSVPVKPAIAFIQKKLEADKDLHLRTTMSPKQIISLLEFCLTNTYFTYQGKFYEQTDGIAIGSPMSPIVANLFMEDLEVKALATSPHQPSLWKRFVDDTFIIIKKAHKDSLLQHLNSIDNNIKFTCEESRDDCSIPFLDILIFPGREGKLETTVYRKPTHTDLYLQWDSHHNIPANIV